MSIIIKFIGIILIVGLGFVEGASLSAKYRYIKAAWKPVKVWTFICAGVLFDLCLVFIISRLTGLI